MLCERTKTRKMTKFVNFLATILVVFSLILVANGDDYNNNYFSTDNYIKPNYTDVNKEIGSSNYTSSDYYDPGSMAGLFKITNSFMDAILEKIDPTDFFIVKDKAVELKGDDLIDHVKDLTGYLTFLGFLCLLIVLFPLVGLIFCCCRCCGNCGATVQPKQTKSNCTKIVLGIFMGFLLVGFLFCVVSAFGSSELLNSGVHEFPENIENLVHDIDMYFNNTNKQLNTLLVTNFKEFKENILSNVENGKNKVLNLIDFNKTIIDEIENYLNSINKIKDDTAQISNNLGNLENAINKSNEELNNIIAVCDDNLKEELKSFIYDKSLPTFENELAPLDDIQIDNVLENFKNVRSKIDKAKEKASEQFSGQIEEVKSKLNDAATKIDETLQDTNSKITDIRAPLLDATTPVIADAKDYIDEYMPYVHAVVIIFSCILLFITLVVIIGIIWGICCKSPKSNKKEFCSKAGGSKFLMCGVGMMFFFGFLIALIALAVNLFGVLSQRLICDNVDDIDNSKLLGTLDDLIDLSVEGVNISNVVRGCHRDEAIYEVFKLENQINLTDIVGQVDVGSVIDDVVNQVNSSIDVGTIINNETIDKLKNLSNTNFEFSFDTTSLNNINVTNLNAPDDIQEQLNTYDNGTLQNLKNKLNELNETIENIKTDLKFDKESTKVALDDLLNTIDEAETSINNKKDSVIEEVKKFADVIKIILNEFIDDIIMNTTKEKIGTCQPLYTAMNAALISTCKVILYPVNGFWFSLFLVVIFFIPAIVIAVILASLYQKPSFGNKYMSKLSKKKGEKDKKDMDYYYGYDNQPTIVHGDENWLNPTRYRDTSRQGYNSHYYNDHETSTRF